jgi:S1-C subfamily serine protease
LDSAGRLIGVNTQIASPSGTSAGIGFAIPVDTVNRIVPELIRHGRIQRPMLGVEIWPDRASRSLGVRGVLLREVAPGGSAARAGLRGTTMDRTGGPKQLGDLITAIDDRPVSDKEDLLDALVQYDVGDEVRVTYLRDGETRTTTVRLQAPAGDDQPG